MKLEFCDSMEHGNHFVLSCWATSQLLADWHGKILIVERNSNNIPVSSLNIESGLLSGKTTSAPLVVAGALDNLCLSVLTE